MIDRKPLPDWLREKIKDWNGHYKQVEPCARERSQSSLEEASSSENTTPAGNRSTSQSRPKESGTGRSNKKKSQVSFVGVTGAKVVAKRRASNRRTSNLSHLKDELPKV